MSGTYESYREPAWPWGGRSFTSDPDLVSGVVRLGIGAYLIQAEVPMPLIIGTFRIDANFLERPV